MFLISILRMPRNFKIKSSMGICFIVLRFVGSSSLLKFGKACVKDSHSLKSVIL